MKVLRKLLTIVCAFFGITFFIYWFNIDMKLVKKLYFALQKHYDSMKRDRRL